MWYSREWHHGFNFFEAEKGIMLLLESNADLMHLSKSEKCKSAKMLSLSRHSRHKETAHSELVIFAKRKNLDDRPKGVVTRVASTALCGTKCPFLEKMDLLVKGIPPKTPDRIFLQFCKNRSCGRAANLMNDISESIIQNQRTERKRWNRRNGKTVP